MLILGIDTSGHTASCALCTESEVLAENFFVTKLTHSQVIMPMAEKILADSGKTLDDLDAIAAVKGPGSYTGLRIGISAVKGMCFPTDKPCAGVSALETLAYNFRGIRGAVICAVMHARQNLVYNANFRVENDGKVIRETEDRIIPAETALREISGRSADVYFAGDYAKTLYSMRESVYGEGAESNQFLAPPALRISRASSLCFAAMEQGFIDFRELSADYLQITKAEKDLLEKET